MAISKQVKGTLMSFIGILILSIDTLFLREMSTLPDLTVAFWRYLIFSIAILLTMFCIARRKMYLAFRNMGYLGIIAGLLWGGSNFCFTAAVQNTAAANVLVINASNTIFSVIFSYFLLGDPILLRTAVTTLVCFGAIVLVFSSEFGGGTEGLVGNLYALAAAVTLGLYLPLCRLKSMTSEASNRKILTTAVAVMDINSGTVPSEHTITELDDIMEVMGYNVIAGFTVSIISAGLGADTLAVTLPSVAYLLINGIVILGLSFCLLSIGPMYVPAAEVSLMFLVETVLGPCWVYLGGYEKPPIYTVYGGVIMIIALACNSILAIRQEWRNQNTAGMTTNVPGAMPAGHLVTPAPASAPSPPPTAKRNGDPVHDILGTKNFDVV